jgi:tetratricopeptide (TPR) repeat protein
MRLAREGYRVVQRQEEELSKYAYIYKARGDYYQNIGDTAESINHYKKALELDKGNPEAHLELGTLYLKDNMLQFAFREYSEAYKNIGRLYDKEDRYNLLLNMAETRYREAYFTTLPSALRSSYVKEGIKYAREALGLYPDSVQANYFLGTFYFKSDEPSDVDAKNHFMKVIQGDPENVEACVSLAELYYNHKNRDKALYYAEEALKIDGTHERARLIKELSQK